MRHNGGCRHLHGHNYFVKVAVEGPLTLEDGMVIDFHDLKVAVKTALSPYDHAFVLERGDNILREIDHQAANIVYIDVAPTAENLACIWEKAISQQLDWLTVKVISVTVCETRDCEAIYAVPNR
jgi:6-pyruvoyltetrahydropterin/6-carboxytetrahydropterin synthase